jgi:hypothetical protein
MGLFFLRIGFNGRFCQHGNEQSFIFWYMTPCSPSRIKRRFGGTASSVLPVFDWFLAWRTLNPEEGGGIQAALYSHMREALSSSIGQGTRSIKCSVQSVRGNTGIVPTLGHHYFPPTVIPSPGTV